MFEHLNIYPYKACRNDKKKKIAVYIVLWSITMCFHHFFTKQDNFCDFLFASLAKKNSKKWPNLRKEFAPVGANSFLYELTLIAREAKQKLQI